MSILPPGPKNDSPVGCGAAVIGLAIVALLMTGFIIAVWWMIKSSGVDR